jgi:ferric-dicitrate binding protein FerR (iron transport regulator)
MRNIRSTLMTGACVAAAAIGGGAIANAATTTSSSSAATPAAAAPSSFPAHGTAAHEDAEKVVTGAAAAKAKVAAVKIVGSGKAGAVTTDMTGTGYETTVTKADGSTVEIHLDSSYNAFQGRGGSGRYGG